MVLPNKIPTSDELWWHQFGLPKLTLALFSCVRKGILARRFFVILLDPDKSIEYQHALRYRRAIINYGGAACIKLVPEIRWKSINIVIGSYKPSWANYYVRLYSCKLIKDAIVKKKYDPDGTEKYRLPLKPPFKLNIVYLSSFF